MAESQSTLTIKTYDGIKFVVDREAALLCPVFKSMIEEHPESETLEIVGEPPIKAAVMKKVIEYLCWKKHLIDTGEYATSNIHQSFWKPQDDTILVDTLLAAQYLQLSLGNS